MPTKFENLFNDNISKHTDINKKTPLLVAVSGGIDSMVLLNLLHKNGFNIAVAHCNFMLRSDESDYDQKFVEDTTNNLGIELFVKKLDTLKNASKKGISIQMSARELRLEWMNMLAKKHKFKYICLAHHLDDSIETFFLNTIRGTGIKGLKGIETISGNIFRPLLCFSRKEIEEYYKANNLIHREDSSNAKDNYQRNSIRHNIIPVVEKFFPNFKNKMADNFSRFSSNISLFEELIKKVENEIVETKDKKIIIDLKKITQFSNSKTLLFEILYPFGYTFEQCEDIHKAYLNSETSVYYSSDYEAYLKSGKMEVLKKTNEEKEIYVINNIVDFSQKKLPLKFDVKTIENNNIDFVKPPNYAFFDASKITFPLTLRKWKHGDNFIPFGMKKPKTISDFFIDLKLTKQQKDEIWLLSSNNKIIWVVGYRTNNEYKVSKQTKNILFIKLKTNKK